MPLEPEQNELLIRLVEAARSVPRESRGEFLVIHEMGSRGSIVQGNGLHEIMNTLDLEELAAEGVLDGVRYGSGGKLQAFRIGSRARDYYAQLKSATDEQTDQVEADVLRYLNASEFKTRHPAAFEKWSGAAELLWRSDTTDELSTIGHKCREAIQEFATSMLELHTVDEPTADRARTRDRLSAVINAQRGRLGDARTDLLDSLYAYWKAAGDLIQRQEHAGQREGEPLVWEDGRRAVFQTAIVMYEVDRSLA